MQKNNDSFEQFVSKITERIETERKERKIPEKVENNKENELRRIKEELSREYDFSGTGDPTPVPTALASSTPTPVQSDEERKTAKELVHFAVTKGVMPAIKKVEKERSPYLMDLFHDTLARHIHQNIPQIDPL